MVSDKVTLYVKKPNVDLTPCYSLHSQNKMKLFAFALGLIQSATAAADFDCVVDCYRDVFRGAIKLGCHTGQDFLIKQ